MKPRQPVLGEPLFCGGCGIECGVVDDHYIEFISSVWRAPVEPDWLALFDPLHGGRWLSSCGCFDDGP